LAVLVSIYLVIDTGNDKMHLFCSLVLKAIIYSEWTLFQTQSKLQESLQLCLHLK